jgi:hypothetical protein
MAQGEFTKEEAQATTKAVEEIMKAMPKSKAIAFVGHFNDIFLFLAAAERAAPGAK